MLLLVVSLVTIPGLISAAPNPSKQRPEGADTFSELEKLRSEQADLLRHLNPNRDGYKSAAERMFLFGGIFIAIQLYRRDTLEWSVHSLSLASGALFLICCLEFFGVRNGLRKHDAERQSYKHRLTVIDQTLLEIETAREIERAAAHRDKLAEQNRLNEELRQAERRAESKRRELQYWLNLGGHEFEHEFAGLLNSLGWSVEVTKAFSDGGIDIYGKDEELKSVAIQCKRWKARVGVTPVRELRGVGIGNYERLVVVGTGGFTKEAKSFAASCEVELWDSIRLKALLNNRNAKAPKTSKRSQATATSNLIQPDLGIEAGKPKGENSGRVINLPKSGAQADVKAEQTPQLRLSTPAAPIIYPYEHDVGESYMNESQLQHFQMLLMDWKNGLEESLTASQRMAGLHRIHDRTTELIEKIDSTLDRIKKDDFGYCSACGLEIGIRRLELDQRLPCIDCKTLLSFQNDKT